MPPLRRTALACSPDLWRISCHSNRKLLGALEKCATTQWRCTNQPAAGASVAAVVATVILQICREHGRRRDSRLGNGHQQSECMRHCRAAATGAACISRWCHWRLLVGAAVSQVSCKSQTIFFFTRALTTTGDYSSSSARQTCCGENGKWRASEE